MGLAGRVPHVAHSCSGLAFQWRPAAEADWGPSLTGISKFMKAVHMPWVK